MWKRRILWGTFAFVMFFVFTLGIAVYDNLQPASAAVNTNDKPNTLQNTKTAIQAATTAVNTATQIANQVKNLASMSPEGILASYLGISNELGEVVDVINAYNGLMSATNNMNTAWNAAFKQVDSFFDGNTSVFKQATNTQTTLNALQKTYKDSMTLSNSMKDISNSTALLEKDLNYVSEATGMKSVQQAHANISALIAKENMKQTQLLGNWAMQLAGYFQLKNQEAARAAATNLNAANSFQNATATAQSAVDNSASSSTVATSCYPSRLTSAYSSL